MKFSPMSNFTRDSCSKVRKDRAFYLMKLEVVALQLTIGPSKLLIRDLKPIFKITPVVSAFAGNELVLNLTKKLKSERKEAVHIATQLSKYGYIYPVEPSNYAFKDDSTLYRIQSVQLWPSQCNNPNNMDYSVYLEKKLLLKMKLAEHEQEAYDRFRVIYSKNWADLNKKALKIIIANSEEYKDDRSIVNGEERAFWRIHCPPPGEQLVMEASIQKRNFDLSDITDFEVIQGLEMRVDISKRSIRRNRVKLSHSADLIIQQIEKLKCHDPFLKKNQYNPWINDFKSTPPINPNKFQVWSISFDLLLRDKLGRELFMKYLDSEVSSENLKFCEDVTAYKMLPASHLKSAANQIFKQYCGPTAVSEINIDGKTLRTVKERMVEPDRYTFDPAQNYIYDLMRKDPYTRFLKSKYFTEAMKKYSMDRKHRRNSRMLALPLNAESIHLHDNQISHEFQNHRDSLDLYNLRKSSSMDTLTESIADVGKSTYVSPHSFIEQKQPLGKPSLHRNTSGSNLMTSHEQRIRHLDEVEENLNNKFCVMSNPFQENNNIPSVNNITVSKLGGSFEELSLTQPVSPNINLPKPKNSRSQSDEKSIKRLSYT